MSFVAVMSLCMGFKVGSNGVNLNQVKDKLLKQGNRLVQLTPILGEFVIVCLCVNFL